MRDIFIMLIFLGFLPQCFLRPMIGMLVWTWFSIVSPHREAFGFAYGFNFNLCIAVATMTGWLLSAERKLPPLHSVTVCLLLFWAWIPVTLWSAMVPEAAYEYFLQIPLKVFVYALLLLALTNTRARTQALAATLCVASGYHGIILGLIGIARRGGDPGGADFGPMGTLLADRNHMALALVSTLPLFYYFNRYAERLLYRRAAGAALVLSIITVITSYSRGGALAMTAAGAYYAVRSKRKGMLLLLGTVVVVSAVALMPASWTQRVDTNQKADESLQGRFASWNQVMRIVGDYPLTGGGFRATEQPEVYARYPTTNSGPLAVHSIYFQALCDHGIPGTTLIFAACVAAYRAAGRVRRRSQNNLHDGELAAALQASLVGYAIGGAALSMLYYDGLYILLVCCAALDLTTRHANDKRKPIKHFKTQHHKK